MKSDATAEKRFEEALAELEKVVERLESGELALEEALATFEEGVRLVEYCNRKLNEVEKRIEVLMRDREGKLQLKLLEEVSEKELREQER
jgi:exodeoxyribonuclease VII small subunit